MPSQWSDPEFVEDYSQSATRREINWYEYEVNIPDLFELITPATQSILDFGSGPGDITNDLSAKFPEVEGCDSSEAMVELARKTFPSLNFFKWEALSPLAEKAEVYDLVFSKLTVHFIEDLNTFAKNIFVVIKPGGSLIISVPHPISTARKIGTKSYWEQVEYEEEIGTYGISTTFIHRSIQDYFRPFRGAGFVLAAMSEPEINQQIIEKHHVDPSYASIPRRLNLRFQKV